MDKIIFDHEKILDLVAKGKTNPAIAKIMGCCTATIQKYMVKNNIPRRRSVRNHTEESKLKMKESRQKWLKENPDKHPWLKAKYQSEPCENVKEYLKTYGIPFISEYAPQIPGRFFSIDIAIPDKMVAIEINGSQHYDKNQQLLPYFQERHDLLEHDGWTVYEISTKVCFNIDNFKAFFEDIINTTVKKDFNYFTYIPRKRAPEKFCACGTKIAKQSNRCSKCNKLFIKERAETRALERLSSGRGSRSQVTICSCGNYKWKYAKLCRACSLVEQRNNPKITKYYCSCGNEMYRTSSLCTKCYNDKLDNINKQNITCSCGAIKHSRAKHCMACSKLLRSKPTKVLEVIQEPET